MIAPWFFSVDSRARSCSSSDRCDSPSSSPPSSSLATLWSFLSFFFSPSSSSSSYFVHLQLSPALSPVCVYFILLISIHPNGMTSLHGIPPSHDENENVSPKKDALVFFPLSYSLDWSQHRIINIASLIQKDFHFAYSFSPSLPASGVCVCVLWFTFLLPAQRCLCLHPPFFFSSHLPLLWLCTDRYNGMFTLYILNLHPHSLSHSLLSVYYLSPLFAFLSSLSSLPLLTCPSCPIFCLQARVFLLFLSNPPAAVSCVSSLLFSPPLSPSPFSVSPMMHLMAFSP